MCDRCLYLLYLDSLCWPSAELKMVPVIDYKNFHMTSLNDVSFLSFQGHWFKKSI